ncbi:uncharacterized protein [Haliotis asinina]|uniref:uncharacterized protein isoform X2 n=1 Tax=Haliotis asinina TaxID=109174 RepID=UPI003531BACA
MASTNQASNIVKVGYVEVQSRHIKTWSKRWFVLHNNTTVSPARLVKYLDEKDAKKGKPRHEYFVNDMEMVERLPGKPRTIHITLRTKQCTDIYFTCDSEAGAEEWFVCLQKAISTKIDIFPANIISAQHTTFKGEVSLYIADGHLTIIQEDEILSKIPLTTIRKYKQEERDLVFWIETGRSSPVGEGFITCQSAHAYNILTQLDDQARRLNSTLSSSGGSDPTANSLYSPDPCQPPSHPRPRYMSEPCVQPYLPDRKMASLTRNYSTNSRPNLPRRTSSGSSSGLVRPESRRPSEPALTQQSANPYLPMNNPVIRGPPPPLRPPVDDPMPYTDMAREADYLSPIPSSQDHRSPDSDKPHEKTNEEWDYLSPLHPDHHRYWMKNKLS